MPRPRPPLCSLSELHGSRGVWFLCPLSPCRSPHQCGPRVTLGWPSWSWGFRVLGLCESVPWHQQCPGRPIHTLPSRPLSEGLCPMEVGTLLLCCPPPLLLPRCWPEPLQGLPTAEAAPDVRLHLCWGFFPLKRECGHVPICGHRVGWLCRRMAAVESLCPLITSRSPFSLSPTAHPIHPGPGLESGPWDVEEKVLGASQNTFEWMLGHVKSGAALGAECPHIADAVAKGPRDLGTCLPHSCKRRASP